MQLSLNSGLVKTTLKSKKTHAFAGMRPDACKFMQTHANTCQLFCQWMLAGLEIRRSEKQ